MVRLIAICCLVWAAGSAIAAEPETVRVGVTGNPPIAIVDPDGHHEGLAIDVLRDIAADRNWRLDFVTDNFPALLGKLDRQEIDVLVGIAYSDERAKRFEFTSQTLVSNWGVLYRRPDVVIDTITDIDDIRVAVVTGTIHARQLLKLAEQFDIKIRTVETDGYRDALAAVDDGRAEAAAVSRLFGLLYSPGLRVTETAIVYNPVEVRFAGPKGADPRFLSAIDTYLAAGKTGADPRLQTHLAAAFGVQRARTTPTWLYAIIGGVAILFALAVGIAFWLKREVARRTASLEASEQQFREIIENMPDPFYRTDATGTVVLASPSCHALLGYRREEIIGRNLAEFYVSPKQRQKLVEAVLAGKGKPVMIEAELRHKAGHAVILATRAFARFDADGNFAGIEGITRDISDRIAAEKAQRESEERFALAVKQVAIWDWDIPADKLYCSPYLRESLGYSEEEFAEVLRSSIRSIVHPDEQAVFIDEIEAMKADPDYRYHNEHRYRLRDGSYRWFESRGHCVFDAAGNPVRTVGMMIDIDHRKQAEAASMRLGRILERSFNEILLFDPDNLRFVAANEGARENLGYDVEALAGMTPVDIHPEMTEASFATLIAPLRDGRRSSVSYEASLQRRDGTEYPVDVRVELIRESDRPVFVAIATDITDRRAKDRQLLQAVKTAEEANKAKSEFLASMSHELRTPLNAILGFAQMMDLDQREPLGPLQRDSIRSIIKGGSHLLELVNDILDLARIEAEQLPHTIETVPVNEIVRECVDLVRTLADRRNIVIADRISDGPDIVIDTDRLRFKQCLLNLLSNAIKYNVEGGSVDVAGDAMPNGFVRISVRDSGIGIPASEHACIFRMFHRVGANPMLSREGAGIGLSVTRMLIEQLAGQTGFSSEPGAGSTFWFDLPLAGNREVLIWTHELRTGIDPFDRDNQAMAGIVNRLSHLSADDVETPSVAGEAIEHARYCLERLEVVMTVCGFTDSEDWQQRFRHFIGGLSTDAAIFSERRDVESLARFRQRLRSWWIDHIAAVEAELTPLAQGRDREIRRVLGNLG